MLNNTERAVLELDVNDPMHATLIALLPTEQEANAKAKRLTELADRLDSDRYYIVSEPLPA